MKKLFRKIQSGQTGVAALATVLILLIIGGLVLVPSLAFVTTGLKAAQVNDSKMMQYYAANSGIDDGLWRIKSDNWPTGEAWIGDTTWDEFEFSHARAVYSLPQNVNAKSVSVSLKPVWVLDGLETYNQTQKRTTAPTVTVSGSYNGTVGTPPNLRGMYRILILDNGGASSLFITRIACWLPAGFHFVSGSSNLEKLAPSNPAYKIPVTFNSKGGIAIEWDYGGLSYNSLPAEGTRKVITFEFTTDTGIAFTPVGDFCWVKTTDTGANNLAWNTDLKVFEVTSVAGVSLPSTNNVTAIAYTTKKEFQKFGSVMEGDYFAMGNTLMRDTNSSNQQDRDRLYNNSSYTISSIPTNATVEKVFLYWTGWKCKPWNAWNYTDATRQSWPATYGVDKIAVNVDVGGVHFATSQVVTATTTQVLPNGTSSSDHGWSYSGYADITSLVKNFFSSQGTAYVGNGQYTVGHWDVHTSSDSNYKYRLYNFTASSYPYSGETTAGYTRYPLGSLRDGDQRDSATYGCPSNCRDEDYGSEDEWAHSAWSIVVVYSSSSTKGHMLYVYDSFRHAQYTTINFPVSGFLTPPLTGEPDAAKLACFIGEGDSIYTGDSISVIGHGTQTLSDSDNPSNNVFNSKSRLGGTLTYGIDIDNFNISSSTIQPGDSQATVRLVTDTDAWNLIYLILSFRSSITTGGIMMYRLE